MLKKDVIQQEESVHGELLDNLFLVNNVLVLSPNADQKNSEYGHFLRSVKDLISFIP